MKGNIEFDTKSAVNADDGCSVCQVMRLFRVLYRPLRPV